MSAKFIEPSRFTDPDAAARKLVEIANATEAVQDGRIYIERINAPSSKRRPADQFRPALAQAIKLSWLWRHESGGYVKFTEAGAGLSLAQLCRQGNACVVSPAEPDF